MWAERRIEVFMLQRWSRVGCDDRCGVGRPNISCAS